MRRSSPPVTSARPYRFPAGHAASGVPRRGVTLIVVLAILAACVVLSISFLQAEATLLQIARNVDAEDRARRAAEAGLAHVLSEMQSPSWAGVGTTREAEVGRDGSGVWRYQATVSAAPADGSIEAALRVGLVSVGTFQATGNPRPVVRTMEATLQLVPRVPPSGGPSDQSANAAWDAAQQFAVFAVNPMRVPPQTKIVGDAWSYDKPEVYAEVAWPAAVRDRAGASGPEPITGTLTVHKAPSPSEAANLTALLGAGDLVQSTAISSLPSLSPTAFATTVDYRVYAGGPVYRSTAITTDTLAGGLFGPVVLGPTATNPLGIYYRHGSLTLAGNVRIAGTLVVKDNLFTEGTGIEIRAVRPPAAGGVASLPAVVVDGNLDIRAGTTLAVTGLVYAANRIHRVAADRHSGMRVSIDGATMSKRLDVMTPPMWEALSSSNWTSRSASCPAGTPFLPWLAAAGNWPLLSWPLNYTLYGLSNEPTFTVTRPTDASYVPSPPLFRPDPSAWNAGGGYRWEVIRWGEAL